MTNALLRAYFSFPLIILSSYSSSTYLLSSTSYHLLSSYTPDFPPLYFSHEKTALCTANEYFLLSMSLTCM
jgi:hypothetical protein